MIQFFFPDMLHQWHTVVEQMHADDPAATMPGADSMYTGTNYSITGTATPINMMNSGSLMGPSNDGGASAGYGTLRSTGGQMFDALSDKVRQMFVATNLYVA